MSEPLPLPVPLPAELVRERLVARFARTDRAHPAVAELLRIALERAVGPEATSEERPDAS